MTVEPYNPDNPEDGRTEMDVAIVLLREQGYRVVKLLPFNMLPPPGAEPAWVAEELT